MIDRWIKIIILDISPYFLTDRNPTLFKSPLFFSVTHRAYPGSRPSPELSIAIIVIPFLFIMTGLVMSISLPPLQWDVREGYLQTSVIDTFSSNNVV